MSFYKELSYDHDVDTIRGIQFCIMSPESILARSVCEVNRTDTFNGSEPWPHGLFDPRMGVIDHNKVCVTCEQKNTFCPGHFGHIVLAKPVFYVQFFNMVRNVLKCVCFRCSKLLIDPDSPEVQQLMQKKVSRQKRWETVLKLCAKVKRCGQCTINGCGAKLPNVTKDGMLKLAMEWKDLGGEAGDVKKQILNAEDVLRIFRRVNDRDSEILGFHKKHNRPEHLICTVLPVPPPSVRPSVRNDTGQRSEDDLTHKLSLIIKDNNNLKQKIEKGAKDQIEMYAMLLQYDVATLIDNTMPGIPPSQHRTGRPIRSLVERLKGKEGRIRGNLMGKRVDFSARSVITPDPNISIDELGVPIKIAMNLTYPEIVNNYNMDELRTYVMNGPDNYPGAKYVRKVEEGRTIRLRNMNRSEIVLEMGDVVERHLMNGDYVLFNRQPSLHRSSMMAHKVKVMPYNTFRLNVMVTPSFNADFDGDEMNMHVAQSLQTHEELLQLAAVPTQIISPREAKPIVSVVQDIVLGLQLLTKPHVRISQKQMSNIMAANPLCTGTIAAAKHVNGKVEAWTGHQLMSTIMPRKINMEMGNSQYEDSKPDPDHFVVIKNGQVLQGMFDKDTYQARTHGIIHSIYNEYGPEETKVFFDNTQKMICNWLVLNGFSVGISDLVVDDKTMANFKKIINDMKTEVMSIINTIHSFTYENDSTKTNSEDFERKVNGILNKAIKDVGDSGTKQIDGNTNRLINMIKSKSKGNTINVSQMIGCLGQQNVDGRRIPYGFDDRTLPHFTKYDDGPESRGFVENSFINGLTPQEFFFSAMGGREGLIDTAVQSVTGDTTVIILVNGQPIYTTIGEWIDRALDTAAPNTVRYFTEKRMELLDVTASAILIPTTDYGGNVTWGEVTAITRHDPGTELYQVVTESGRKVIVTESKSLLVWQPDLGEFKEVPTPEIRPGMFVPVTANLPPPPTTTIVTHITVPGTTTKLELDHDFGVMCGLFLSAGYTTASTTTSITSTDQGVQKFIKEWFAESGIPTKTTATTISGTSKSMAHFMEHKVGHTTIPAIAFVAPEDFLRGLLNGYVSGEGIIYVDRIDINTPTPELMEGLIMVCSRLGIPTSIWMHRLIIQTKIDVVNGTINSKIKRMEDALLIPAVCKDVLLDKIIEIHVIEDAASKYPKVYDLTIPSTLNFGLANGLQVRDTSETGYIQRKLVKAMEDCKVGYDRSVRNASGTIIQFLYGEDGMDASKIESQKLPTIECEDVRTEYSFSAAELKAVLTKEAYDNVKKTKAEWEPLMTEHLDQLEKDREFLITKLFNFKVETSIMYPVSFARTIKIAKGLYSGPVSDLEPKKVLETIQRLSDELFINTNHRGNQLFHILLRSYLSPKMLIVHHRLCTAAFDYIVQQVRLKYYDSLAHPSEMVGVIAAQSIGEPATQLTLNTFHLAGVSAASKTVRGVPRLKELLSVSKNMKTPTMRIHFKDEYKNDLPKCLEFMNDIRLVRFKDIVDASKIFFDPNDCFTDDSPFIRLYKTFLVTDPQPRTSPWLLRLEFNKEAMLKYNMDMILIHQKLMDFYRDDTLSCMFSDDNADKLIFRIKLNISESLSNMDDTLTELKALEFSILEKIIIKGTENIERVSIVKEDNQRYNTLTSQFEAVSECVVYSDGTNLRDILALDYVNPVITSTNNIIEVFEVLGIEAARQALYNEIQEVLESVTVNYRHISMLIDVQTNKGYILSIDRHGINRGDIGPLAKCSFEETTDKLIKAGIFAEYDKINGVSANIILGQVLPAGTGDVEVLIDEDKLPNGDDVTDYFAPTGNGSNDAQTIECEEDNFSFNFTMPQVKMGEGKERKANKLEIV